MTNTQLMQLCEVQGQQQGVTQRYALLTPDKGLRFDSIEEVQAAQAALKQFLESQRVDSEPVPEWDARIATDWVTITLAIEEAEKRGYAGIKAVSVKFACSHKQIPGAQRIGKKEHGIWRFPLSAFLHWLEQTNTKGRPRQWKKVAAKKRGSRK